jgi:hypothetical protein
MLDKCIQNIEMRLRPFDERALQLLDQLLFRNIRLATD